MSNEVDLPEFVMCPECKQIVSPRKPVYAAGRCCHTCEHPLPKEVQKAPFHIVSDGREVWWKPEMDGMTIPKVRQVDPTKRAISEALAIVAEAVKDRRKRYVIPNDVTEALSDVAAAIHKAAQDLLK